MHHLKFLLQQLSKFQLFLADYDSKALNRYPNKLASLVDARAISEI